MQKISANKIALKCNLKKLHVHVMRHFAIRRACCLSIWSSSQGSTNKDDLGDLSTKGHDLHQSWPIFIPHICRLFFVLLLQDIFSIKIVFGFKGQYCLSEQCFFRYFYLYYILIHCLFILTEIHSKKVFMYHFSLGSLKNARYWEVSHTYTDFFSWELAPCYSSWQWL